MPRPMVHPRTPTGNPIPKPVGMMVTRLRRMTSKGYAELDIIEHTGSHHKPGDVILVDWDDYLSRLPEQRREELRKAVAEAEAAEAVVPPPPPPQRRQRHANTRKPSKGKSKKAAR